MTHNDLVMIFLRLMWQNGKFVVGTCLKWNKRSCEGEAMPTAKTVPMEVLCRWFSFTDNCLLV
jgi:hypothetical protein